MNLVEQILPFLERCPTSVHRLTAKIDSRSTPSPQVAQIVKAEIHHKLRAANLYESLASRIPPQTILVEESPSSKPKLHRRNRVRQPMGFLSSAMGGLGFAMPASVGLRMGCDRPVIAIVGDGSSLYSIQSIWSAVHYHVGVVSVITNNGSYSIMDRVADIQKYRRQVWPPLNHIDISKLAEGFGCKNQRIENHAQLYILDNLIPKISTITTPLLLDSEVESDPTSKM